MHIGIFAFSAKVANSMRHIHSFLFLSFVLWSIHSYADRRDLLYSNEHVSTDDICGHVSLYYCLKTMGVDVRLRDLLKLEPPAEGVGVDALQLKNMAAKYNVRTCIYKNVAAEELKYLHMPIILWVKSNALKSGTANHFVYLDHSLSEGKFVIYDGERRKELVAHELDKIWSHIAITFSGGTCSDSFAFCRLFFWLLFLFAAIVFGYFLSRNLIRSHNSRGGCP